jgi:antitoxin (DNA-binding transcriptional repressor) of toxin-antitoxin stability system
MHQVSVEEAKTTLPDLIDAAVSGAEVIIAKDPQHVVKLVPVVAAKASPQFGSARGLIVIGDDFEGPIDDLKDYME